MKDNPLLQAMRDKQQPIDMGRMMQLIEEIHAMLTEDVKSDKGEQIVRTQQSQA
jgi:hypothetical protein